MVGTVVGTTMHTRLQKHNIRRISVGWEQALRFQMSCFCYANPTNPKSQPSLKKGKEKVILETESRSTSN